MGFEPATVDTERLLSSRVFDVDRVTFREGAQLFTRDVVRHRGAVAVLAYDGGCVVLVSQWRAPLGRSILEVPAGTRDVEGEPPEETARRELEEEAGVRAGAVEPLCTTWNSPGWSDQRTIVFLATDLVEVPTRPSGPEEAAIEVVRLPLADALAMIEGPDPCDATTVVALRALAARVAA